MQISSDTRTMYERIGGEAPLKRLVDAFYRNMRELPETRGILALHEDLDRANDKLFMFLSGWMGGPSLYIERYGHPRLRMRHLPFPIAESERDQWMRCMRAALDEVVEDAGLRDELYTALYGIADFMRNSE